MISLTPDVFIASNVDTRSYNVKPIHCIHRRAPLRGRPRALDYAAAERAELVEEGRSVEEVACQLVGRLEGMPIWGHPRTQINVVPPPSIPSVIGSLLPAIYNPNLVSDDTSYGLMETEAAVVAMVSRLVGYDPVRAAGVFTLETSRGGSGVLAAYANHRVFRKRAFLEWDAATCAC